MKKCFTTKKIGAILFECPLKDICARGDIKRGSHEFMDDVPYNFEEKYCKEFIWKGLYVR